MILKESDHHQKDYVRTETGVGVRPLGLSLATKSIATVHHSANTNSSVRSYSKWGINVHYKMHGLDSTQQQRFQKNSSIASLFPVPEYEIYPSRPV